ncbi:hypothetical protein ACN9ML_18355 [Dyadobacter endophyticus]|uniref:hypothetical protein n=1 Tax=Dyadobacter endophyticus TaxID=1749036 RepID=UPI003CE9007A
MEDIMDGVYINPSYERDLTSHFAQFKLDLQGSLRGTSNTNEAWVVYTKWPRRAQAAAFKNKELADLLHGYLEGSEPPVSLHISKIRDRVKVDEFKESILFGKRPFTVLMQDGEIFEVWGYASSYECDVANLSEPEFGEHQGEKTMSGTFWAWDTIHAVRDAKKYWKEHVDKFEA